MSEAALHGRDEPRLVARARAGSREAFERLVAPHRRGIHVHCYRMLGSLHEAEDLLQETLLRAWRSLDGFEGRSSVRGWLYRIATNACLDALKSRRRRLLPDAYAPPDDPTGAPVPAVEGVPWIEPYPDHLLAVSDDGDPALRYDVRQSMELAFIAAMQFLSPRQRAVLILRDALGYSARETATILETSVAAVTSALQRARSALASQPGLRAAAGTAALDEDEAAVVTRYLKAWEAADVEALVALLREDARMTMPPTPSWYDGRDAVAAFFATFLASELGAGSRLLHLRANGQPAFAVYGRNAEAKAYRPIGIKVLTLEGDKIRTITGFTEPGLFRFFDLPPVPSFDRTAISVRRVMTCTASA